MNTENTTQTHAATEGNEDAAYEIPATPARGAVITGTVLSATEFDVVVDVGYKYEGVVSASEFDEIPAPGSTILVEIRAIDDEHGRLVLGHRDAARRAAWEDIVAAHRDRTPVRGLVSKKVKGGYIVDCGIECFLPFSKSGVRRGESDDAVLGREIVFYIDSIDERRTRAVVDRKTYLEEERQKEITEFLPGIKAGDVLEGTVTGITNFGAFVKVGPIEGLVRKGDVSWRPVDHPSQVVRVGQEVRVVVLDVDAESHRLLLGIKQAQRGRWHDEATAFAIGQVLTGTVKAVVPEGVRVSLSERVSGFLPGEELGKYVRNLSGLTEGDQLTVRIKEIDELNRRVILGHPTR